MKFLMKRCDVLQHLDTCALVVDCSALINSHLAIHLGYLLVAFSVLVIHDLLCKMLLIQISTNDDGATQCC